MIATMELPLGLRFCPSEKVRSTLDALDRYEFPELRDKLIARRVFPSEVAFDVAFREFKRYVALGLLFKGDHSMGSKAVDEVWHQFILFTREYHSFCHTFLGRYLHHAPATSRHQIPASARENLRRHYIEAFGEPEVLWSFASATKHGDAESCSPLDCHTCCKEECKGE